MKLNDFEQYVDKVIMARGLQYYKEERIESIEEWEEYSGGFCISSRGWGQGDFILIFLKPPTLFCSKLYG
jgi:hypothetical protein